MSKVWSRKRPCKVEDEYLGSGEFNWCIRDCDGEPIVSGTSESCDLSLTVEKELRKAWDRFADDLQARLAETERRCQRLSQKLGMMGGQTDDVQADDAE